MAFFTPKYNENSQLEINNYIHQNINSKSKVEIRNYLLSKGAKHGQIDQGFQENLEHHSTINSEIRTEKLKPLKTQNKTNNLINYDSLINNQDMSIIVEELKNNSQISQTNKQITSLFIKLFIGFIILTFVLPLFLGLITLIISLK